MPVPETLLENAVGGISSGYQLLVMDPEQFVTHPLPPIGTLTIGRGDAVDVQLTDPLASRQHARLYVGATLEIEDLGSANKTRLHDAALVPGKRVLIAPGEAFAIGSTILMVQQRNTLVRPRRLWPHGYFEARLEEECARSETTRDPFAVVRLHVEGNVAPTLVADLVRPALRLPDMLAQYAPGEYEMLLASTQPEFAMAITADVNAKLKEAGLTGRTGLATYPRDGRTPEELVAVSCSRVRGTTDVPGGAVVVHDPIMERVYQLARRAAAGTINVLIVGETGVGKEVMAEQVHQLSPRADKPFLCLNCASLSESLLESELFGHERGAFTGATEAKPGLLETAPGGTVFLDEIGELPLALQAKLLRVLETKQVTRVGSLKARAIDVRFLAATNRNLEVEVPAGRFRPDLYFRLNAITLQIPPLRMRRTEILPLALMFLERFSKQLDQTTPPRLSSEARTLLEAYVWPGNIRELRNVMERAALLCTGDEITADHLPLETMTAASSLVAELQVPAPWQGKGSVPHSPAVSGAPRPPVPLSVPAAPAPGEDPERDRILRVLAECGGNQSRAARELGIARSTLVLKLDSYQIVRPRKTS